MTDDTQRIGVDVDKDLYQSVKQKTEHGEISDALRDRLRELAYGADVSERERLQEQLKDLREERRELDAEIQRQKADREELDRKIERTERRLTELQNLDGKYDGMLETIESQLHEGVRFPPGGSSIQQAAEAIDATPEDVIADLKERNPDVPDEAFRQARPDEPARWTEGTTETLHK